MKTKIPAAEAMAVAVSLLGALHPFCERIEIAGSLRRKKPFVGDVELLYVPKWEERRDGLFDTKQVNLAEEKILDLLLNAELVKRLNKQGKISSWGQQNKYAVHAAIGIPVDLFSTTEDRWWMSLVIRTGPKELNIRLMTECRKNGLEGEAYGTFTKWPSGEIVPVGSEREVFQLAGIPWLEPEQRKA